MATKKRKGLHGRDGTPEDSAVWFGAEVKRLRKKQQLTREQLGSNIAVQIDPDDPPVESYDANFIGRIENGRKVKLSRAFINALCRALGCDQVERDRLLLYADRNVLGRDNLPPDQVADILNSVIADIYREANNILSNLISDKGLTDSDLHQQDKFELVLTAIEIVLNSRRGDQED